MMRSHMKFTFVCVLIMYMIFNVLILHQIQAIWICDNIDVFLYVYFQTSCRKHNFNKDIQQLLKVLFAANDSMKLHDEQVL